MAKAARNAGYTKEYNRKMFLRLLRQRALSRAEIARQMGLTRACTSLIAEELLQEGLVEETAPAAAQKGRTPIPLQLRAEAGYAVGVYLNRDGCTVGVVDMRGGVLCQKRIRLEGDPDGQKLETLISAIRTMVRESRAPWEKLVGVGISAPGPVDGEGGRILNPPRFDLWHYTDIGPVLENALQLPVYLENNASCLARYNLGKPEAQGSENFLLLLVDSGVGSGVISGGKVLKGAGYFTSELGHTSINYQGRGCACGNIGCLEVYAAVNNLLRDTEFSDWHALIDALPGSVSARQLLRQEAEYLAAGIINMTNMISIDTVLIAGELLYGIEHIIPLLETMVNERMLRRSILPIRVLPSCAGANSRVQAAADVAFGRYLVV